MQYIKLFWKLSSRAVFALCAAAAVLCSAADFFAAVLCGAALRSFLSGGEEFWRTFVFAVLFWVAAQCVFLLVFNFFAGQAVFSLKKRVLTWFLCDGGDSETAKMLCAFGISRQVWFFSHRYLRPWLAAASLVLCAVFLAVFEPVCAAALLLWCAVSVAGNCALSRVAQGRQRAYAKEYTDEMDRQYEMLADADGVRRRGEERYVISRLISLWRKFRGRELSLYRVFSATRLGGIFLSVLGACVFVALYGIRLMSAESLGVMLYATLLLLPTFRQIFRKGPWVERSEKMCAQLLEIVNKGAAE